MKDLLTFVLSQILGNEDFAVEETVSENGFVTLNATVKKSDMGLVIGKNGKTIKAIRSLLRTKATLEKIGFTIEVIEKSEV